MPKKVGCVRVSSHSAQQPKMAAARPMALT